MFIFKPISVLGPNCSGCENEWQPNPEWAVAREETRRDVSRVISTTSPTAVRSAVWYRVDGAPCSSKKHHEKTSAYHIGVSHLRSWTVLVPLFRDPREETCRRMCRARQTLLEPAIRRAAAFLILFTGAASVQTQREEVRRLLEPPLQSFRHPMSRLSSCANF